MKAIAAYMKAIAAALIALFPCTCAVAKGDHSSHGSTSSKAKTWSLHPYHHRIPRSPAAKHAFIRAHPCPSTGRRSGACPGYIIDHVKPLACGGADSPGNMQWQTVYAAKQKDKWERRGCR